MLRFRENKGIELSPGIIARVADSTVKTAPKQSKNVPAMNLPTSLSHSGAYPVMSEYITGTVCTIRILVGTENVLNRANNPSEMINHKGSKSS